MTELIDLTLTLGSERVSLVPGLVGVETESIQTHATHARSNQKLCLATHIGTHVMPLSISWMAPPPSKTCRWRNTPARPFCWTSVP